MKLSVISDLHLGDPACTLVSKTAEGFVPGPKYAAFKAAAGTDNDYLVLLGDLLELAIADYADAYAAGAAFLQQVAKDGIAQELLYVPGNHDFSLWHVLLHEFNVINQVKAPQAPRMRWTVPAVLDDRAGKQPLSLANVAPKRGGGSRYGGLFLDELTKGNGSPGLVFNVAYPNVYFVGRDGEAVLLTHGHHLEPWWSLVGELAHEVAAGDLQIQGSGGFLGIEDLVSVNFPFNELASAGVGQAGPLTELLITTKEEMRRGDFARAKRYLDRLGAVVEKAADFPWYEVYLGWLTDAVVAKAKASVLEALGTVRRTRYDAEFTSKPAVKKRFRAYFVASLLELQRLNGQGFELPNPRTIVFGHTHEPIQWGSPDAPSEFLEDVGDVVRLYNTGGWLHEDPGALPDVVGGAVFKYESAAGWSSLVV